jgi:predicted HAD superfamily Cof-like phosphohydrolase
MSAPRHGDHRGVGQRYWPTEKADAVFGVGPASVTSFELGLLDGTTEFMRLAKQPMDATFSDTPEGQQEARKLGALRMDLLAEEYSEYVNAERRDDLVEVVDGLLDVIVIAWGTLITYLGEDRAKAAAAEVVRSNLEKVIGEGLPIFRADGKVLKPEGWTPPDIAGAIA